MNCGADAMALYDAATKTLTICGKGAMTDFASAADQPWKSLQGQLQTVCFEPFITAIGTNAFSGCSALTAANIEGTATTIADGAFDGNATGRRIFVPAQTIAGYGESAYAADIYSAGQCGAEGSDVSWELNAKTMALSISGTGAMADYASYSSVPWYSVRGKITSVTIAEGVTSVGSYAFYNCSSMATVSIPAGVTSIGSSAFQNCAALTAITLPASVTTIGGSAFYGCSNLANVTIPDGVTTIGSSAFQKCAALTAITLPAGLTSIGGYAFRDCSLLTEVNIFAPSLQTYGYNAFMNTPDGLKIYVPAISLEEYKTQWSAYADKFVALPYYALTMKEGTQDADKWTVKVGDAEKTVTLPITNLKGGETITLQYNGRLKVKGVKATSDAAPAAPAFAADEYNEASWDGTKVVFEKKKATTTPVAVADAATNVTWGDGWYTVSGNVTITGNVTLGADTHLILQDGATLTINGQLDAYTNQKNLYIYGQRKGDGKLNITNSDDAINSSAVNRIDIHGGEITAVSTNLRAFVTGILNVYSGKLTATSDGGNGIQFSSSFDVYGGEVEGTSNATSSDSPSRGISDGGYDKTLTVYGGKVTATGNGREGYGDYGSGINCYVKSGTSGIKFYFSDNGTDWDEGTRYASATSVGGSDDAVATKKRYVKAE